MFNKTGDGLLSGILGAVVFLVFLFFVDAGVVVSSVVGVLAFGTGFLLFSRKKPEEIAQETDHKASLDEGKKKLARILRLRDEITKPTVVSLITAISTAIAEILQAIAEDPSKLRASRQFLNYYLDSTLKILGIYVDLAAKNLQDEGIQASLSRVETLLQTLESTFKKQLARLMSDDVMDLDTELSVLEQTIKMEGLGK